MGSCKGMAGYYRPHQPEMDDPAAGIVYREYPPGPALSPYIFCYWSFKSPREAAVFRYHAVPDACVDLYFDLSKFSGLKIVGIATRSIDAPLDPGADFFGIRFLPGRVSEFFRLPVEVIHDRASILRDMTGPSVVEFEERLASAFDNSARISVAEAYLHTRLASGLETPDRRFARALENIALHEGRKSIECLAADAGLGTRQFNRIFTQGLGMSPKVFSRTVRFQSVLGTLLRRQQRSVLDIVLDAGYYDQSHFYHDFFTIYGKQPVFRLPDSG